MSHYRKCSLHKVAWFAFQVLLLSPLSKVLRYLCQLLFARGCSLKKILVHPPKKSQKSEKIKKIQKKSKKSEKNPKNPKNPQKIPKINKNPKNPKKSLKIKKIMKKFNNFGAKVPVISFNWQRS